MDSYQDWNRERKQKCKRGFVTKREMLQWEQQFILYKKASMDVKNSCKLYEENVRPEPKKSTWLTKNIINHLTGAANDIIAPCLFAIYIMKRYIIIVVLVVIIEIGWYRKWLW